jgi:hypothetical protein
MHDECHPIKPISSLSAYTKQQPGNTRENSDSHRVINTVRAQKFSTEKCTQGRVVVNQSMFAFNKLLTGKLTGTPTNFSTQSRTLVNKTPLYKPLRGRPRTATGSRCRIPPSNSPFYPPFCSVQVTHPSSYPSFPDQCGVQYVHIYTNSRLGIFGDCF